jgi:hypothetical protein
MATENSAFWTLGLVFMALELAIKEKWEKDKIWKQLAPEDLKLKLFIISILELLLLGGVVLFLLKRSS